MSFYFNTCLLSLRDKDEFQLTVDVQNSSLCLLEQAQQGPRHFGWRKLRRGGADIQNANPVFEHQKAWLNFGCDSVSRQVSMVMWCSVQFFIPAPKPISWRLIEVCLKSQITSALASFNEVIKCRGATFTTTTISSPSSTYWRYKWGALSDSVRFDYVVVWCHNQHKAVNNADPQRIISRVLNVSARSATRY